jgi:5'-nucleotidase
MFEAPLDLARSRILVTNDDGIQAPGIKILEAIARTLSKDVWVVAPETEQSAASHSLTLRRPLRIRRAAPRRFAVDGTPTDCVLLAINHILKADKPTLCLSGVNRGGNLGEDVTYSGTIAAAMEATLLGVPSVALSQVYRHRAHVPWDVVRRHAPGVLRKLVRVAWPRSVLMNVNFPDCAPGSVRGAIVVSQGRHKIGDQLVEISDPRGEPYYWIGAMRQEDPTRKGTDIAAIKENRISVTPLFMDLTHRATMRKLASEFR